MYLKSLEVNGFKSFARKSDLEFSTAITGIVGPNGSGKSNIAEAFRFVLGEQSIKSMRGKRGEDLIFNGSTSISRANRGGVKITLDNTKKHFPIDYDEITIERIVYRDGTNEYLLNGARTRLRDVQELLASANIGSTGHHIISQGEADRILTANARERREMIEDALGLKVFQYKKAESERKLVKTRENIAQVETLRREVIPHLRFLERQVKKIEKSLELRGELTAVYAEYLKREDEYIAYHHDRLEKEEHVPREELARLERELEVANQKLKDAEKDEKRDALVAVEGKLRIARDERQKALREVGKLEGQISYLERRIAERSRKQVDETRPPISFARVEEAVLSVEDMAERASKDADSGELLRILEGIVRRLRSFLNDISREGVKEDEGSKDEDERDTFVAEKKKLDGLLQDCEKEEEQLRAEYEALKTSIEAELSESRDAEREVFRIMGREQELQSALASIEREKHSIERDRMEFKRELEEAVSLIGRGVTEYFNFVVLGANNEPRSQQEIASEERGIQLERRRQLEKMKIRLEELGAGASDDIMKEYKEAKDRDEFLAREIEDLTKSVASLETLIRELAEELNKRFADGIDKIATEFATFFTLMFGGGSAALRRVKPRGEIKQKLLADDMEGLGGVPDEEEDEGVIQEGIEIDISLPNKRVRGLEMLSGGERALTSIALIFAMSQVNPPPFVILDETDAALDEANSKRYGDMIAELAKKSQLILITHNRETMSRAGVLYGITMGGDGVSKLLSVKFEEAVEVAK